MKCIIFILISCFSISKTTAQGGSDINYISRDLIDSNLINREVKLDLGKTSGSIWREARFQDTIKIFMFGGELTILEHRKFGVDYWYYADQTNECIYYINSKYAFLNRAILMEIESTRFQFKVFLDIFDKSQKGKLLTTKSEIVWIDKNILSGIFLQVH